MIPSVCKMPDLADCLSDRLQGRSLLHAYFLGDSGMTSRGRLFRRNFVRLIDKALYEYQAARRAILNQIAEAQRPCEQMVTECGQIVMCGYINHLENHIDALNRPMHLFDRLKREAILSGLPRNLRKSPEARSRSLPDVANAFTNVDDLIVKMRSRTVSRSCSPSAMTGTGR
jgi:hypothetical protein